MDEIRRKNSYFNIFYIGLKIKLFFPTNCVFHVAKIKTRPILEANPSFSQEPVSITNQSLQVSRSHIRDEKLGKSRFVAKAILCNQGTGVI
jgi:hypothetical protein